MQAIVLARRDFRENDQLIVLYTLEKGKISTLARGVKKITGKNSAFLEPFFFVEAEIIPGKEINHLTTAVGLNVFKNIRASLDKSLAAGRIVTLLDKCLGESEPDKKIFLLLKNWLEYLDAHDFHRGLLVGFLARFFRLMGLAPVLDRCVVCGKARPAASKKLFFSASRGGVVCSDCQKISPADEKILSSADADVWNKFLNEKIEDWPDLNNEKLTKVIIKFCEFHGERKLAKFSEIL